LLVSIKTSFITLGSRFAGVRQLPLHCVLHYEYFLLPCFIGINQLDCYFFYRLLTGYLKLKDFWRKDLPPLSEGFLNGPLLCVLWWTAWTSDVGITHSCQSNVYGWLWTAV